MFALARRGFLLTGSARGGERLAIAFTLVDNCLALGVNPERYLVDAIDKLERSRPLRRLSELIPQNWAAEQARRGTRRQSRPASSTSRSSLLRAALASHQATCKGRTAVTRSGARCGLHGSHADPAHH